MSSARPFFSNISKPFLLLKWKVQVESHLFLSTTVLTYKNTSEGTDCDQELKLKSTVEGMILQLLVKEGDVVQPGSPLLMLKSCSHELIVKEICAHCGADLQKLFERLPGTYLKVTPEQAEQLEIAGEQRLLKERKLALLICLDKTLVDTVDVQDLPSTSDDEQVSEGYCTKVRPGTRQFLEALSQCYELHFFTDGKLCYANKMAEILDPTGSLFCRRIWTRQDCFDSDSKVGNLKAIFPHGTSMVCIIDTSEDKFKDCSANVIYIKPYNCLPLQDDPVFQNENSCSKCGVSSDKIKDPVTLTCSNVMDNKHETHSSSPSKSNTPLQDSSTKTPDKQCSNTETPVKHCSDTETSEQCSEVNYKDILTCLTVDRAKDTPLNSEISSLLEESVVLTVQSKDEKAQVQHLLPNLCAKVDDETADKKTDEKCTENNVIKSKVVDDDKKFLTPSGQREEENRIMQHLKNFLIGIHKAYYDLYDQMVRQEMYIIHHKPIPEVKNVIPYFRHCILKGVNIVFSGVIPTNVPKETSNLWILAKFLGANVSDELVLHDKAKGTTHIIATKLGTNKTNTAKRFNQMHIVTPEWLYKCATYWKRVDEKLFHLSGGGAECSQTVESTDIIEDEAVLHDVSKERDDLAESPAANDIDALSDDVSPTNVSVIGASMNISDIGLITPGGSHSCLTTALNLSPQELDDMNTEVYEECTSDEGWPCDPNPEDINSEDGGSCEDSDEESRLCYSRKRSHYPSEVLHSDIDCDSNSNSCSLKRRRYLRKCYRDAQVSFGDYYSSEDSSSDSDTDDRYGYIEDDDASFL